MKKVVVLVGPTAVGKTSLSIELAKVFDAEIISGDSIQVFKGFSIGSGKVTKEEMQGVVHHGIDILEPKDKYSVADFQSMAREKIDEITNKGHLPIIVGGTGLYIKACIYDYMFSKQGEVDESIVKKFEGMSNEELFLQLQKVDVEQSKIIHQNNRKRMIRALMIFEMTQTRMSEQIATQEHKPIYDAFIIGCTMDREALYDRINQRVELMVQDGLEDEIRGLINQGVTFEDHAMQGIGYREWQTYFEQAASKEEVIEEIKKHSRQFAKRQYTWFNNQMPVHWVDMNNPEDIVQVMSFVKTWRNET